MEYEEKIGREAFLAFRRAVMSADQAFQASGEAGTKTWLRDYLFPALEQERVLITLEPCSTCKGTGWVEPYGDGHTPTCGSCNGSGRPF